MCEKNISGPYIRQARLEQGLTQVQLSKRLKHRGLTLLPAAISAIERQTRAVKHDKLLAFAETLEVNIDWLIGWGE